MSHFYVDDQLPFHPKVLAAGNEALGLWVRAGAWAKANCTGGYVPTALAASMAHRAVIARLVKAGLWEVADGGYQFHDWSDVTGNHTPEREREIRRANADRQAKFKARQKAQTGNGTSDGPANSAAHTPGNGTGNALPNALETLPPVPDTYGDFYLSSSEPERESYPQGDDGPGHTATSATTTPAVDRRDGVDLDAVQRELAVRTGRIPSRGDLLWVVGVVGERAERSKIRVANMTSYVLSAIRADPFEWQKQLDQRGAELAAFA